MLLLRCRLAELAQSLELYGLDPSMKLNPPRARIDPSDRTFESSNYRLLVSAVKNKGMEGQKMSSWLILHAVKELIKIHAPETWAKSFVKELIQSKKHKEGDLGTTAQYLCECDIIGIVDTLYEYHHCSGYAL